MFSTGFRFSCMLGSASLLVAIVAGCATAPSPTGFLSDYSRLEPGGSQRLAFADSSLGQYSKFIIEPVVVRFHDPAEEKKVDHETIVQLREYMEDAISKAISDRYAIVSQPGPGVARLRVALTDLDKSTPALNVLPQTKLTGLGVGGAAMEAELLDSQTGVQIAAVVQKKKGSMLSFSGLKKWGDAKAVMDAWAKRFRERLDEAHGG